MSLPNDSLVICEKFSMCSRLPIYNRLPAQRSISMIKNEDTSFIQIRLQKSRDNLYLKLVQKSLISAKILGKPRQNLVL